MFHKNRKLAALEPRHLLPVWLLEMYWERPRNLFFHYARCCCCRCQRCLLLLPASCWTCCCRYYASALASTSAVAAVTATATSAIRHRLLATNVCVCVRVSVVRVKRVCDEVENMLHVQPNELRSRLRQQQQRICRRAALLLLLLYCNVMRNCCASFN